MTDTLRIKRRAAGGAAGPPASLAASELAYNEQDDNLYYGKGNSAGAATSIIAIAGPGFVSAPSSTTPLMDGTAAVGTGTTYARADHVHPSDTSRAPIVSPTFTGTPAAPTPATADNSTNVATTAFVKAQGYASGSSFLPLTGGTLTGNLTLSLSSPQTTWSGGSVSAAPAFVNASTFQSATATSITVTLPSGRVNGNLLIAWAQTGNSAASLTLSGAGWIQSSNVVSTGFVVAVAYAYVTGSEVSPVWTLNTADTVKAYVMQYSGAAASAAIGSVSSVASTTAGTTFTASAITTTRNNSVVAAMFYTNGTGALGTPASYTSRASQTTLGNGVWSDNTYATGGTSTGAISCTGPAASTWNATLIEILAPKTVGTNTLLGQIAGSPRWALQLGDGTSESGSNAGSNLVINRYSDGGTLIGWSLSISRSTGSASFFSSPTVPTPAQGDASTLAASTLFVRNSLGGACIRGYLFGLTLSTAGSSATFSVAAGVCANSTNVDMMVGAAINKTTGAWVEGSNAGSLDTGTIAASTWYHVHVIKRLDTNNVDILISLSAAAPTLPSASNYTEFRRIGSLLTDGSSHWTLFHQLGDEFLWDAPVLDVSTTTLSTTATVSALSVPPGVQVRARFRGYMTNAAASVVVLITSPDESVQVVGVPAGNYSVCNAASNSVAGSVFTMDVRTNTSAQIRYVSSNASTTLKVSTYGWYDRRGRDN